MLVKVPENFPSSQSFKFSFSSRFISLSEVKLKLSGRRENLSSAYERQLPLEILSRK